MTTPRRTPLHDRHTALGAKMVDFAGWSMPIQYSGTVGEHLATRTDAGLFDVSHMGRFVLAGPDACRFLQHALTNDAARLDVGESHYTLLAEEDGGAIDDAYLYRFCEGEYLLVVNAANRQADWDRLESMKQSFDVQLRDQSGELAMLALQGPHSAKILEPLLGSDSLPEPKRNACTKTDGFGGSVQIGRTGYTGEPVCFELFLPSALAASAWDMLLGAGTTPVGLGARDTLRTEAALPLYGHELGADPDGTTIPILACPTCRYGVSLTEERGDFVGRSALEKQQHALDALGECTQEPPADLPKRIRPIALVDAGVAREGAAVCRPDGGEPVGWITSGTRVPIPPEQPSEPIQPAGFRSLGLAYVDSTLPADASLEVESRGKRLRARLVRSHLRMEGNHVVPREMDA